jgi:ABC-type antimicrobial peptide transport system permease subunit
VYVAIEQIPRRAMTFVLRTTGDAVALSGPAYQVVRAVDPAQAITELTTFEALADRSIARPRFFATVLSGFALLALTLAAVGIYGVLAFTVRQRTREIGIRTALGADRRRTLRLVISQGMVPVAWGLTAGMLGALVLSRFLGELLFGTAPVDAVTYLAVGAALLAVAVAACWIPGFRATRIHPMEALRNE